MVAGAEVNAVQDEIQILAVRLDLGLVDFGQGILDRQLMEVKHVIEDAGLFRCRFVEVHPQSHTAVWSEPGGIHRVQALDGSRRVLVNLDQSPTFTWSAAWAAARRATGMRYGEALT